ncbi:MAG TPA: hypothetical protein EYQ81_02145 [Sneathiellales bacterium]|nr:hypothetical protein [Sneathiellales bacterium]
MKATLSLIAAVVLVTACSTEPGGREVGWRATTEVNNPEGLLETTGKTSGHYRAWIGESLMVLESSWGEPDEDDGTVGGAVHYTKIREYENMNSDTWTEKCEVTLQIGAGEVITSVEYQGRECRHPLMQFKFQKP